MDFETILKIISIVLGIISTSVVPLIVALVNSIKKMKAAKTAEEKAAALNDMLAIANDLIASSEEVYKGVDTILKARGESAGEVKKDRVMTKLQAHAIENGYEFDAQYWSEKIDELVAFTKEVNSKK